MAFTGNLTSISVLSLLRTIRDEGFTGILSIESQETVKQVFLEQGKMVTVMAEENRLRLGTLLVEMRLLLPGDLESLLADQRSSGVRLGQLLLDKGMIEEPMLQEVLRIQMEDMLLEILSWSEGIYNFLPSEFETEELLSLSDVAELMLEEGLQQPAELRRIVTGLPSLRHYPLRGAAEDRKGVRLSPEERFWLTRADGRQRLRDLLMDGLPDPFEALLGFTGLVEKELLTFVEAPPEDEPPPEEETRELLLEIMRSLAAHGRRERGFQQEIRRHMKGLLPILTRELPAGGGRTNLEHEIEDSVVGTMDAPPPEKPVEPPQTERTPVEPEPASEPAPSEPEVTFQPVAGTEDDPFPWFQPGEADPTEEVPATALPDEPVGSPPAAGAAAPAGEEEEFSLDFDLPDIDGLSSGLELGDETAPSSLEVPEEEAEEELELFEDRVAKKVRYNKLKGVIKMAYNRIRLRKPTMFEILEVSPNASTREIMRSYKRLRAQFDTEGILQARDREFTEMAKEVVVRLDEARAVLEDEKSRRSYLRDLKKVRLKAGEKKKDALQRFHAGMSAYNQGDVDLARKAFQEAISLDPNNPVFYDMIDSMDKEQKAGESTKYFRASMVAWKQKNDRKRAAMLLSRAIQLAPKQAMYHQRMGEFLSEDRSHWEEALKSYSTAFEMDPGNVEIISGIARIQMKMNRLQEAADRFAEVLHWDDRNMEARRALEELKTKKIVPKFRGGRRGKR